ncbi:hypothetical protein MRX96_007893 [Rhipicephalus microplus]
MAHTTKGITGAMQLGTMRQKLDQRNPRCARRDTARSRRHGRRGLGISKAARSPAVPSSAGSPAVGESRFRSHRITATWWAWRETRRGREWVRAFLFDQDGRFWKVPLFRLRPPLARTGAVI